MNDKRLVIAAPVSYELKERVIKEADRLGITQSDYARIAMELLLKVDISKVLKMEVLKAVREEEV